MFGCPDLARFSGWWTVPDQPGHPYNDTRSEPYGRLHAAVATFTRGPVSPADRIGYMNRTMIMRSCMDDGTLLSADVPATAIDGQVSLQFLESWSTRAAGSRWLKTSAAALCFSGVSLTHDGMALALALVQMRHKVFGHGGPAGEVWSSTTTVSGYRFDHILSATLEQPYDLVPADLRYNTSDGDIDVGSPPAPHLARTKAACPSLWPAVDRPKGAVVPLLKHDCSVDAAGCI